jgi:hypothetical protein
MAEAVVDQLRLTSDDFCVKLDTITVSQTAMSQHAAKSNPLADGMQLAGVDPKDAARRQDRQNIAKGLCNSVDIAAANDKENLAELIRARRGDAPGSLDPFYPMTP